MQPPTFRICLLGGDNGCQRHSCTSCTSNNGAARRLNRTLTLPRRLQDAGSALAEKCHAFAKALHYKELEFQESPGTAVEALISINNQLRQPEAAIGVLTVAQQTLNVDLKVWESMSHCRARCHRHVQSDGFDTYGKLDVGSRPSVSHDGAMFTVYVPTVRPRDVL